MILNYLEVRRQKSEAMNQSADRLRKYGKALAGLSAFFAVLLPLISVSTMTIAASAPATEADTESIIYRETFSPLGNPAQYLRIARAAEDWEIIEQDGERVLRVYFEPTNAQRGGLVVWDLVPMQFRHLSIQVRPQQADAVPVFMHATLFDREGTSYTFRPFSGDGNDRASLNDDTWNEYAHSIPNGLTRIFARGAEVAPFLHGRGDQLEAWDTVDFENRGFRTLHFHIDFAPNSPAIGKRVAIDFKGFTLRR
jgi:hypothetical protein